MPVPKRGIDADPHRGIRSLNDNTGVAAMNSKLAKIIIPNIEFRSTTISDAIEFLRQEARAASIPIRTRRTAASTFS